MASLKLVILGVCAQDVASKLSGSVFIVDMAVRATYTKIANDSIDGCCNHSNTGAYVHVLFGDT